jgi:hypothetical protein
MDHMRSAAAWIDMKSLRRLLPHAADDESIRAAIF